MKNQAIKLNIENPCHEDWDKMQATEKGKFCLSCQKNVIDFSKMSTREIIEFLSTSNEKICGRIPSRLINAPLNDVPSNHNSFFNKYVASLFIALGFISPAKSQSLYPAYEIREKIKPNTNINKEEIKKLIISGKVTDSVLNEPIAFATITIKGTHIQTTSDMDGKFKLEVPPEFQNSDLTIEVIYVGYKTNEITALDVSKSYLEVKVVLKEEELHLKGEIMVVGKMKVEKQPSNWQKLKTSLKGNK